MKTALEMLDRIDTFLVEAPQLERRMLWDILCAMRGPDKVEDRSEKEHTTAVIRAIALPKSAAIRPHGVYADFNTKGTLQDVVSRPRNFSHFSDHITYAAHALAEARGEDVTLLVPVSSLRHSLPVPYSTAMSMTSSTILRYPPMTPAEEAAEIARVAKAMEAPNAFFVFGSNLAGIHGGGAALTAKQLYGATQGQGDGMSGRSYALPTKDFRIQTLLLSEISDWVNLLRFDAYTWDKNLFVVTRVGCGLAGYSDEEIAPIFHSMPKNVLLPPRWLEILHSMPNFETRVAGHASATTTPPDPVSPCLHDGEEQGFCVREEGHEGEHVYPMGALKGLKLAPEESPTPKLHPCRICGEMLPLPEWPIILDSLECMKHSVYLERVDDERA